MIAVEPCPACGGPMFARRTGPTELWHCRNKECDHTVVPDGEVQSWRR